MGYRYANCSRKLGGYTDRSRSWVWKPDTTDTDETLKIENEFAHTDPRLALLDFRIECFGAFPTTPSLHPYSAALPSFLVRPQVGAAPPRIGPQGV